MSDLCRTKLSVVKIPHFNYFHISNCQFFENVFFYKELKIVFFFKISKRVFLFFLMTKMNFYSNNYASNYLITKLYDYFFDKLYSW